MFGYDELFRRKPVCTDSGQFSGDHQHKIVRLEFGKEAVRGTLAGASRGMHLLVVRTVCRNWLALVLVTRAFI